MEKSIVMNGKNLYYSFLAGAHKIIENQQELNRINVFPVPDGDTGTNLASTIRSIVINIRPDKSYKNTADAIALAALDGARGNSGVIFAQFLYGVSAETSHAREINVKDFAETVKNSVNYVYEAVSDPVEGTMLTVIREWADAVYHHHEKIDDFIHLLEKSFESATKSLKETTSKLKVLAKTNVVDAGAKGFVLFLEGISEYLKSGNIKNLLSVSLDSEETAATEEISHETITYRYCTEAMLKGNELDKSLIRNSIKEFGDSLVIAGSNKTLRIHIHTDKPQNLFSVLREYGNLTFQKADDMVKQYDVAHNRKWNIALVTDSSCDLPDELIDFYQIQVVPINMFFGENHYLDKATIRPDQFYTLLKKEDVYPTSAQPNEKTFVNLYSHLASHYDSIISLHLGKNLSGTWYNSFKAAETINKEMNKKISVIDSRHLTGTLGLITLKVAQAIEKGLSHEEITGQIENWMANTKLLVSVKTLKYLVKGGRVSPMKGIIGKILNLKPIISLNEEGRSVMFDKSFSRRASMKKVMRYVKKYSQNSSIWNYIVLHANDAEAAKWFSEEMKKLTEKSPIDTLNISPVVGLHAGIGTVAVAFMLE